MSRSLATTSLNREIEASEGLAFLRYQQAARQRQRRLSALTITIAVAPFLLTTAFVFFVASPMYSSEARFAIRGGDAPPAVGPGSLLAPGGSGYTMTGFVDGYAVRDFLKSRDAMEKLDSKIDLVKLLTIYPADPLARVPKDPSRDRLFDAYSSIVAVRYNMIEQIVVLNVLAFSPQDAVTVSMALIELADEMADKMNRHALEHALKVAEAEVMRSEKRFAQASLVLAKWRNEMSNVDPAADVAMLTGLIGQLESQLATAEENLAQANASHDLETVRRKTYKLQVATLRQKISETRKRLGGGTDNAAVQISNYEGLKIAQDFASSNLASARQSLEQARVVILQQQRYVTIIAQPLANRKPVYPDKLTYMGGALLSGFAFAFFGSVVGGLIRNAISH